MLIPDLFVVNTTSDDVNGSNDARSDLKKQILQDLRELSIVIPSAICRLEQFSQAIVFIQHVRQFFDFEEGTWTHAVLNLLHASNLVHTANSEANFHNMGQFHQLRKQALQIFSQIGNTEGQADTYFLWAIMLLFQNAVHKRSMKCGADNSLERERTQSCEHEVEDAHPMAAASGFERGQTRSTVLADDSFET